ncbi:MAG: tRNA lysidine(34) synthetase TilS [Candidatus Shikimatogenerans sp. JK-2022]|nr:tRNA lysidine(34) synthetase TilS [Candidatus Shikimatogenerans bostrichidophilus]
MIKSFKYFFLNKKFKNKKFLIAVSGGIDSIVLLNIFLKIIKDKKNIIVCNCNFNLNKKNSHNLLVFNICYKNNIDFYFKSFNTFKYIKNKKISIQMGARILRYNWFNKILKKYNYNYIITGHHINDDIETFFINLLRNSSIYGLKGIKSINNNIIRPFLIFNINKKVIYNYAKKNNIDWVNDESNFKNYYLRNKVRNYIIPIFKKKFTNSLNNINSVLYKLKIEYNIINNYIKLIFNNNIKKQRILNIIYFYINIYKLLKIRNFEYILYRNLIKLGFNYINLFNLINYLKIGKFIYSNDKKYKIIKLKNRLILSKNVNIVIKKKIKKSSYIYLNNNKIILKINKKKNIKFKKFNVYLNFDLINIPIYIKNWEIGDSYFYNNKIVNINKILKRNRISTFFKDKILFLIDNNDIILSSINKIFIFNKNYSINNNTKNILYYNFLFN